MNKDYSLDALNKFLDYVADKGMMKAETAKGRKVAANKIFEKLTPEERQDLRLANLDTEAERFGNRQGSDYMPASLQVYKSRVKSALSDFFSWVDNPAAFRPSVATRSGATKPNGSAKKTNTETVNVAPKVDTPPLHNPGAGASDHLIFPIPIRPGLVVKLTNIPVDLTTAEAEKIAQVVRALACSE